MLIAFVSALHSRSRSNAALFVTWRCCCHVALSARARRAQAAARRPQPRLASSRPLLHYSLPPDKLAQAYALYLLDGVLYFVTTLWGLAGPLADAALPLRSVACERWAERVSRFRLVQAAIVMSLFVLVVELHQLPFHIYGHHISLQYGLSVQHWGSWFGDWGKGLLLGFIFASFLGWILYAVLRRSPRRWWFYFWLALIPIVIFVMFIEPIVDRADVQQVRAAHATIIPNWSRRSNASCIAPAWTSRPSACSR